MLGTVKASGPVRGMAEENPGLDQFLDPINVSS